MPRNPHNLKVGETCWLVVQGEDKDLANCHEAVVESINNKNEFTVLRPAWTDTLMDLDSPVYYEEVTVSGLSSMEGEFTEKKVIEDEGNGKCCLCTMDPNFKDRGYDDMVDMRRLNDAELARNLRIRCVNKEPYCRCGVTLVAINLYEDIESYQPGGSNAHLYSKATQQSYINQTDRSKAHPHAWSLGSHCFQQLFQRPTPPKTGNNDQAIVITGESGAGKTFTTKLILDFLAVVGNPAAEGNSEEKITDLMLAATPILEGFGNANMPRNPDSSRFGKLYKIYFDKANKSVTGCTITPYMLEKSRLTSQQMNERNFHIFYRMLADPKQAKESELEKRSKKGILYNGNMMGFSPEEKSRYHLQEFEDYVYLKGGTRVHCCRLRTVLSCGGSALGLHYERIYRDVPKGFTAQDGQKPYPEARKYKDAENMSETKKALSLFFTDEQIDAIWRTTAGCLWLGNVDYTGDVDEADVDDSGPSKVAIDAVADLWQVDRAALKQACNTETMVIQKKDTLCKRSLVISRTLRDAMARAVYDNLFIWMVSEMSKVLSSKTGKMSDRQPFIGVLDIFGFEFYADETLLPLGGQVMNTLDQYNINMCNEVLQGEFVRCIFDLEQALYKEQLHEEIEIDFEKNYDTIELMKGRKNSIIAAMDTEITKKHTGKQADKGFYAELQKMAKDKRNKAAQRRLDMKDGRGRREFADGGPYGYDKASKDVPRALRDETPGFFKLDHYAANVTYDVREWVDKDLDKLTKDCYAVLKTSQLPCYMASTFANLERNAANTTVARDFATSLESLVNTLQSCDCNFVRCLKASNPLAKNVFKNALVLNQLKYTGMLDTLIIRRGGFPIRMEYMDFCDQYRVLDVNTADEGAAALAEAVKKQVPMIVDRLEEKPDQKQWNDAIRVGKPKKSSTAPLILMRDWLARELDEQANIIKAQSAVICQAVTRMGFSAHVYRREIAARNIQSSVRSFVLTRPFMALRRATLAVLPEARGLVARSVAARASEMNVSTSNKSAMVAFLEDNISLTLREAEERRQARKEDNYSEKIANARFGERIAGLKSDAVRAAELAYAQAKESADTVKQVIDTMSAKSAEIDARWTKMQSEGMVRSVPLVRQYKANAAPFYPPAKDAYKFRYSFTYKGAGQAAADE